MIENGYITSQIPEPELNKVATNVMEEKRKEKIFLFGGPEAENLGFGRAV
jgi:hypothetical protein